MELYKNGLSSSEISEIYNVSGITILRVLKKHNVKIRENGNKYQQFNNEEFKKQWFGNYSLGEMSTYFKCDKVTIKRHAKRLNLPPKNKNLVRDDKGRFKRKL